MSDRTFQAWFKSVAAAARNPQPITPHTLNSSEKRFVKHLHSNISAVNDKKLLDDAAAKNYRTVGVTADLKHFMSLAQADLYCSKTRVPMSFDLSNTSNEPFTVSFNRRTGSVGDRCKPHTEHLHYVENLDVVCRALNLAQRNFSSDVIQVWIDWIVSEWYNAPISAVDDIDWVEGEDNESDEDDENDDE